MKLVRRVFWPDTHAPYHDPKAVKIAIDIVRDFKPDELVFLGDFHDCYCMSSYTKNPEQDYLRLQDEITEGAELLNEIESKTRPRSVVFLEGNHENRITRYIDEFSPRLSGLLSTREALQIPDHWRYLPYGQKGHYRAGNWIITHGTLCGKHVAASMVGKYGCNVLFGHVHRIQRYQVTNFAGDVMTGLTCGWLGDKVRAAEYVKNVADWSHGLALGWFKPSGWGHVEAIPIERYQAVSLGKLYKV